MSRLLAGRYEVLSTLGVSAASEVFEVRDRLGGALRALKLLRSVRGEAWGSRLRAEFALLSEVSHSGLVAVHDFGIADEDRLFLVMDRVAAAPFDRVVAACRDVRCLEEIAARAAEALVFIESVGLAHGDLKSANLLVALSGSGTQRVEDVRLADFGLSVFLGDAWDSAFLTGTAEYLAPERFLGSRPDTLSDLYSFGATLRAIASGRRPASGTLLELAAAHRAPEEPRRLSDERPDIPAILARAIDSLTAREPRDRPQSASDFLSAIGRAPARPGSANRLSPGDFVGRDADLAAAASAAGAAIREGTRIVLVTGERGSGKSRFLRSVASRLLLDGYRVIWAGGEAGEELAALLSAEPSSEGALPASVSNSATGLDPIQFEDLDALGLEARRRSWFRAASARLSALIPDGRGAILADDADTLDPETAAFLTFLATRADRPGLALFLATHDEGAASLQALLDGARRVRNLESISLLPLAETDTRRLTESILGTRHLPDRLLADLREHVGGNPLLLHVLLRELVREGALASSERGWTYRAGAAFLVPSEDLPERSEIGLSDGARSILVDASVLSHPFDVDTLMALRSRPDAEIVRALREASRAYVLVNEVAHDGPRSSWRSGPTRERFGAALDGAERAALHRRALAHLDAKRRSGNGVAEEEMAAHAVGAGDTARARALLWDGADRAVASLALGRALALLSRLVELGEAGPLVYARLARVATELARTDEAIAASDAALESLASDSAVRPVGSRDDASKPPAVAAVAAVASVAGVAAVPPVADVGPEQMRLELLRLKAWALVAAGRMREATGLLEQASLLAAPGPPGAAARVAIALDKGWVLTKHGEYAAAAACLQSALRSIPPRDPRRAIAWNRLAVALLYLGEETKAGRLLVRALELVDGTGSVTEAALLGNIAFAERRGGRFAEALAHRERLETICARNGYELLRIDSAMERALILRGLNRPAEALEAVEWAMGENRALGRERVNGAPLLTRGILLEQSARWRDAEESYRRGVEILTEHGDAANRVVGCYLLGELAVRRGDLATAETEFARGREIARETGDHQGLVVAMRNDGLLRLERGDAESALPLLIDASSSMGEAGYQSWNAETLVLAAEAQTRLGRVDDARASLAAATQALRRRPNARADGLVARGRGNVFRASEQIAEALVEARRGVALLRQAGDLYQVARTLVEVGELEEKSGKLRRAREAFAEAREIFLACGVESRAAAIDSRTGPAGSGDPESSENFEAICRVMETVAAIREPDRLLATMLDLAIEHVNAERGFIVLYTGDGSGEHEVRASREIAPDNAADLARLSRRILAAAGAGPAAVSSERAIDDPRFQDAPSVIAHNVLSVICAPLRVGGRILGFIYLDNRRRTTRFTEGSVRFVEAFAVQAAFALERAHEMRSLETALRGPWQDPSLIGRSPAIQRVLQLVDRAAEMDHLPVFITGENGTGKELVASLLQKKSARRARPFLRVNCAAFSESLIESELFGHERGAFTGATFARPGIFERANGGTLFLDEIGEIPQGVQIKLLRILQELTLTRVGGSKEIRVDVRLISATNADLERRVANGHFRPDVFYRLQGLHIHLPPLRERLSDIPELVRHFLDGYEITYRRGPLSVTQEALDRLQSCAWPGNVRQLEREIHQALALALAHGHLIRKEDLSATVLSGEAKARGVSARTNLWEHVEYAERELLLEALRRAGWVNTRAASILGCTEGAVRKKIKKYRLMKDL